MNNGTMTLDQLSLHNLLVQGGYLEDGPAAVLAAGKSPGQVFAMLEALNEGDDPYFALGHYDKQQLVG